MIGRELQTADEVIDALGGTTATARLTAKNAQHVSNWRASGRLPAETFLILHDELKKLDLVAPSSLWGIKQPERAS